VALLAVVLKNGQDVFVKSRRLLLSRRNRAEYAPERQPPHDSHDTGL
jgi:hypothetical protein